MMGGNDGTDEAYEFKNLILPVRDIATTIHQSDPAGNMLPCHLRGWQLGAGDGYGNTNRIHIKKLLGMIVHANYLVVNKQTLDVVNDEGRRAIVNYQTFLNAIERLILKPRDIGLVICNLSERRLENINCGNLDSVSWKLLDLQDFLFEIAACPEIEEIIWQRYLESNENLQNENNAFDKGPQVTQLFFQDGNLSWQVIWKRNGVISRPWINVSDLVDTIRNHLEETNP